MIRKTTPKTRRRGGPRSGPRKLRNVEPSASHEAVERVSKQPEIDLAADWREIQKAKGVDVKKRNEDRVSAWVERFLSARSASISLQSATGPLLEQLALGVTGKGVTFHAAYKDPFGDASAALAEDEQVWRLLSKQQRAVLEIMHSPKRNTFREGGDRWVPRSSILERADGEPATHTVDGDSVDRDEDGNLIVEVREGVELVRVHRVRAARHTIADVAKTLGITFEAVRWAIKVSHSIISDALHARYMKQRESA